jgi:uncharacterized protein
MESVNGRLEELSELLSTLPPFAIAFSGGVDSSLLCAAARAAVGDGFTALTAETPLAIREDLDRARRLALDLGFRHEVILLDTLSEPSISANLPDRCYKCKKMVFEGLLTAAARSGAVHVLDGTNADDNPEDRPGIRALRELGIRSPLAELGIGRGLVVEMSRALGLSDPDRPNNACLATRIPTGRPISPEILGLVDRCEDSIRALGFSLVRYRTDGRASAVELAPEELEAARSDGRLDLIRSLLASRGPALGEIRAYRKKP